MIWITFILLLTSEFKESLTQEYTEVLSLKNFEVKEGEKIATLKFLSKTFKIDFEFCFTTVGENNNLNDRMTNLFRFVSLPSDFRNLQYECSCTSRYLSAYFGPATSKGILMTFGNCLNGSFSEKELSIHPGCIRFQIEQHYIEGFYWSVVKVDDVELLNFQNNNPKELLNVNIFFSGVQYDSQHGIVKYLSVANGDCCTLSEWTEWGQCSSRCIKISSIPQQKRTRTCLDRGSNCLGESLEEYQNCNELSFCGGALSDWTEWGECSASCNMITSVPQQKKTRSCLHYEGNCDGELLEHFRDCNELVYCTDYYDVINLKNFEVNEGEKVAFLFLSKSFKIDFEFCFTIIDEINNKLVTNLFRFGQESDKESCESRYLNAFFGPLSLNGMPIKFGQCLNGTYSEMVSFHNPGCIRFQISQLYVEGFYWSIIKIDHVVLFKFQNANPKDLHVNIYFSDLQYASQHGVVTYLNVSNADCCVLNDWGEWSECPDSCGIAGEVIMTQMRERKCLNAALNHNCYETSFLRQERDCRKMVCTENLLDIRKDLKTERKVLKNIRNSLNVQKKIILIKTYQRPRRAFN